MSNTTTSLKLPAALKEKISEIAQGVAQTPHAYMVEAIAQKVARDERRQDFVRDARESLAQVRAKGVVYSHEDVWKYATGRATGKRVVKPRPVKAGKKKP